MQTRLNKKKYKALYDSKAWTIKRIEQLRIQPLCQACLMHNLMVRAIHVDHLFRWQHIGQFAFFNNIFQSLCLKHHSFKTGIENKGIYIHYTQSTQILYKITDYKAVMTAQLHGKSRTVSLEDNLRT